MFAYQKLEVYQASKELAKCTCSITNSFPKAEQFGLTSQMNRAVISIPSNIAEGSGRSSDKEESHFLSIALGSLMELSCQIEIVFEIGYIKRNTYENFIKKCKNLSVKLGNFKKYIENARKVVR